MGQKMEDGRWKMGERFLLALAVFVAAVGLTAVWFFAWLDRKSVV